MWDCIVITHWQIREKLHLIGLLTSMKTNTIGKCILVLICLFQSYAMKVQGVTINNVAWGLNSALGDQINVITDLTITGQMNANDVGALRSMANLTNLDISGVTMLKLSIIIPVYNVEKYIEKCLVNCAQQDCCTDSYEIIVVNDGTKDNSLAIAEDVARRYDNIYITSQLNAGLSEARNKGLSLAKGEYVWFVDSDDWIDTNCLTDIMKYLTGIDVLAMIQR